MTLVGAVGGIRTHHIRTGWRFHEAGDHPGLGHGVVWGVQDGPGPRYYYFIPTEPTPSPEWGGQLVERPTGEPVGVTPPPWAFENYTGEEARLLRR